MASKYDKQGIYRQQVVKQSQNNANEIKVMESNDI